MRLQERPVSYATGVLAGLNATARQDSAVSRAQTGLVFQDWEHGTMVYSRQMTDIKSFHNPPLALPFFLRYPPRPH